MRICEAVLESTAPYSQGKFYTTPKLNEKELASDYEVRTWRDRMHVDANGVAYIPPTSFKNAVSEGAKYSSVPIPGKGKSLYTKHIEAGVLVTEPLSLGIKKEDAEGNWLFVPSDGRRGGTKRVMKCFPTFSYWKGTVPFYILDDIIGMDVFEYILEQTGQFIGIGVSRPRNNGFFGRFKLISTKWIESTYESRSA